MCHGLAQSTLRMLACDCTLTRLLTDGPSQILDVGRATRTIPTAIRRALEARDRGCTHPGCDRPPDWCDAHHTIHYEHGGATSLDNTCLHCRRHHVTVHKPGWHAQLKDGAIFEVTDPTGRVRTSWPPGQIQKRIA